VGGLVVEALQRRGLPVRAMVRREDERAEALSTASAYRFERGLYARAYARRTAPAEMNLDDLAAATQSRRLIRVWLSVGWSIP
jgi:hypothetical protein